MGSQKQTQFLSSVALAKEDKPNFASATCPGTAGGDAGSTTKTDFTAAEYAGLCFSGLTTV
jgi:hypothetical protein